jgi:cellulose biosynthesis protein BcsQ
MGSVGLLGYVRGNRMFEYGAKAALDWLYDKAKSALVGAAAKDFESKIKILQDEIDQHNKTKAGIESLLTALRNEDRGIWGTTEPTVPFADYNDRIARLPVRGAAKRRPLIMTLLNYKGGVGKTTTVANLGAYFDEQRDKRVLFIDLDYQGSLSTVLRKSIRATTVSSRVSGLLEYAKNADQDAQLQIAVTELHGKFKQAKLISSFYQLARVEERVMVEWLLQRTEDDIRYRLARILLSDSLGDRYDVVLIDAAPRLTTATINALCASTHVLVPAIFNRVSAEPVVNFIRDTSQIMNRLNPRLTYVGVVETMAPPGNEVQSTREDAKVELIDLLMRHAPHVKILNSAVDRKPILEREGIAYANKDVKAIFDTLGDEIVHAVGGV